MSNEPRGTTDDGRVEATNKGIVRAHFEAVNDRDLDRSRALHADDVRFHSMGRTIEGFEAVIESWRAQFDAVPDLEDRIEHLVAEDDVVAVRYTTTGTHEGTLLGVPGTGESVEVTSMAMVRIEDEAITEWWNHPDALGFLRQVDGVDLPSV